MRVALLLLLLGGAAWGALPQCSTERFQCYYNTVSPTFGDAFALMFRGETGFIRSNPELYNSLCNRENWYRKETGCDAECPLKFEITSPAHRRLTACAYDNSFQPFVPTAHLDMKHPYNGKEFDLVVHGSPGNPDRMGCDPKSFEGKNYTGKIVVFERGVCSFDVKFRNLAKTGAAIGLLINTRIINTLDLAIFSMPGRSEGFEELPALMVATQYHYPITEPYDSGEALKARFTLSCGQEAHRDPNYVFDGCPHFLLTRGLCDSVQHDEDRFCARCPVEIEIPGEGFICLYGNGLIPRRAENNFFTALSLPTKESIVYLDLSNGTGCTVEEYLPHKGRIVAVFLPSECLVYTAMRNAERAGVRGFIIVQPVGNYYPTFIEGTSTGVSIPVGVIAPWNTTAFQDYMRRSTPTAGGHDSEVALRFRAGEMPPRAPGFTPTPTLAPVKLVAKEEAQFKTTPALMASMTLSVLLVGAIVAKVLFQNTEKLYGTRTRFTVPLGVASTGLSLTLLLAITVTAFLLAYNAGLQAVETAMDSGRRAVDQTHANAVENMEDLSAKLLNTITGSTVEMMTQFLNEGHYVGLYMRSLFHAYDGTWDSFNSQFITGVQINMRSKWTIKVLTTEGFYADEFQKTDDRPDSERNDGQPGVNVTNNGHLYGWRTYSFDHLKNKVLPLGAVSRGWYDPFKMVGGFFGDPLALVREEADFVEQWVVNEYSLPIPFLRSNEGIAPVVTVTPLTNGSLQFSGAILCERQIHEIAKSTIADQTSSIFENITVFVVDSKGLIISSTLGDPHRKYDAIPWGDGYRFARKVYTAEEVKYSQINAAVNFIRSKFGWDPQTTTGSGEFDERDYYDGFSSVLMHFTFERTVADVSGNRWKAETRGGECGSFCYAPGHEGHGLYFDGKTVLHIYSNLTTDVARVWDTRVGSGPWRSTFPVYNRTGILPDGSEAIFWAGRPMLREPFHYREDMTMALWIQHDQEVDMALGSDSPRIYSDTTVGDAAVRWYANGMFFISRISYGCRTKGVPSLTPGVWTHLAAVVNWEERYCAVYVNGVLHDKAAISRSFSIAFTPGPHLVGQYFKGVIDDFQVHNKSLSPEAVNELYRTGAANKIPSRRWYMEFGVEKKEIPRTSWRVVAMVPVEDVRRNVDANNAIAQRNMKVEEQNTQQDLNQITADSVSILTVVALFCMFIFLLFNSLITAPFTAFARLMIDVAVMRVEDIDGSKYVIRELSAMDQAMVLMARNLKEYKSFMPQSVILHSSDSDKEAPLLGSRRAGYLRVREHALSSERKSTATRESILAGAARMMVIGLSKKKVTLVVGNVVQFHALAESLSDGDFTSLHGSVVSMLVSASERGNPGQFCGDRMLVSFNTTKSAPKHRLVACAYIHSVQKEADQLPHKVSLNFSAVSGEAKVGNMGSEVMKQFSIVGPVVSWAYALERHCRHNEMSSMIDSIVADGAKQEFCIYHCDIVYYRKRHETYPLRVSTLVERRDAGTEDWMYQEQELMKKDPYAAWNNAFLALLKMEYEECERFLRQVPEGLLPQHIYARLEQQAVGRAAAPIELPL